MLHHRLRASSGAVDPNFENVSLLLHGDGTNGAQNNTFVDSSTNGLAVTRNGNSTQGSFSPYGDLWSNYFDGSGDYLSIADNAALQLPTQAFTIEAWVRLDSTLVSSADICRKGLASSNNLEYSFLVVASGGNSILRVGASSTGGGGTLLTGTTNLPPGIWHHVAYTRNGATANIWLNGILEATASSFPTTIYTSSAALTVGAAAGTTNFFPGYISNLRILKGTELYTSNFTPPAAPLTAIANTQLLTCQSNQFRDNSSNNFAVTRNGDVRVERFSPFNPATPYTYSVNGGSGYFDGAGDYLTVTSNAAYTPGSGAFTWECWFYPTATWAQTTSAGNTLFITETTSALQVGRTSSTLGNFWGVASNLTAWRLTTSSLPTLFQWNHLVAVRSGTGTNQAALFLNGVRVALGTITDTLAQATSYVMDGTSAGATESTGFISDMRIVKGSAVYDPASTSITVPTAPLTAVSGTGLLLNFTNAGITDSTGLNLLETVGNAQINTSVRRLGTGAMAFDGTGDWLLSPYRPFFDLVPANAWTFEAWVHPLSFGNDKRIFSTGGGTAAWNSSTGIHVLIQTLATTGALNLQLSTNTASPTGASTTQALNVVAWNHVAVSVSGNTAYLAVNGTVTSVSVSTKVRPSGNPSLALGIIPGEASNVFDFWGYMDEVRLTTGVARYTANFAVPQRPLPDR